MRSDATPPVVPAEVPLLAPGQGRSEYQTRRDAAWWAIAVAVIVAAAWAAAVLA